MPFVSRIAPRPPFGETTFVWEAVTGCAQTLPLPSNAPSTEAFDINDRGQVVGFAQRTDPARRIKQPFGNVYEPVVLLTPVLLSRKH